MASFAQVIITLNQVPNATYEFTIGINKGAGQIREAAFASPTTQANLYELFTGNIPATAQSAATAIERDYKQYSAQVDNLPISAEVGGSGEQIKITATEYNVTFTDLGILPAGSWATITITPEVLPVFVVTDIELYEAVFGNKNTKIRYKAITEDGTAPYLITSPISQVANTEADLIFEYARAHGNDPISITDDNNNITPNYPLPTVDIWQIDDVVVTGTAPSASIEIIASRSFTGDVSTVLEYSKDGVSWQSSNVFNDISTGGTAYIRDNYGLLVSQDYFIEDPAGKNTDGYHRYKQIFSADTVVTCLQDSIPIGSKTVKVIDFCDGGKVIKYLNSTGQYRFYAFEKYINLTGRTKTIGKVNKFVTNIHTDNSATSIVGRKNAQQMALSVNVPSEHLEILSDMFTSPVVSLYVGDGVSDVSSDWIEVEIKSNTHDVIISKLNSKPLTLIIELPTYYTVKLT